MDEIHQDLVDWSKKALGIDFQRQIYSLSDQKKKKEAILCNGGGGKGIKYKI